MKKQVYKVATDEAYVFNPLNAELNTICHVMVLLRAHHIFHISGIRVNIVALHITA